MCVIKKLLLFLAKKNTMRFFIIFIFGILFTTTLAAQLNFRVGYQYSYTNSPTLNSITSQLNANNTLTLKSYEKMSNLHSLHGAILGVKYRSDFVGIFAEWSPTFQVKEYTGEYISDSKKAFQKLYYRVDSYSLGLEFFVNKFSFGGSLDKNNLRVRSEIDTRRDRFIAARSQSFGSHFFIGINLEANEHLSIAVQPYVQIPWTKFDYIELEDELNTDVGLDDYKEGFMSFGLKIIFQNGTQH